MTHRQRLETAWSFREGDRVPIELDITPEARKHPKAGRLLDLMDEHVDHFGWGPSATWGFLGLPTEYNEEVIEDVPGSYKRMRRTHKTAAGEFTALTRHPEGAGDYHWEKRYITTVEELRRLTETPRPPICLDTAGWHKAVTDLGDKAGPCTGLLHPLGNLVRSATMEDVYTWFYDERELMHRFLEITNAQVVTTVERMGAAGIRPMFMTWALEMFMPPWTGHTFFDEFVFPYDSAVNAAVHKIGAKHRAHCHGNCGGFLTKFADMGIDGTEPIEHAPRGDVDLARAKREVGGRMVLSGNVASERFMMMTAEEVRREVREAIRVGAPGGGFSLHTSGGDGGTWMLTDDPRMPLALANAEVFLLAALEYGQYPIRKE